MRAVAIVLCVLASLSTSALALAGEDPAAATAVDKAVVLEQKVAAKEEAKPAPKSEAITPAEVQAVDPVGKESVSDAITCLSRTIYWEAKGGGPADMEAVADVVINRLGHDGFADTVCGVVKQGAEKKNCQFSWWCDGRSDQVQEEDRYTVAKEVARKALNQQLKDRTGGALFFHDRKVQPAGWNKDYLKTAETDKFIFYKAKAK